MAVQCYASINHSEICSNRRNSWWHLVLASVYIISYQRHSRRMVIWNVVKKIGRFNHECVLLMKMTTKSSATESCVLIWYCVFVLIILKRIIEEWFKMTKGLILNFHVYIYNKLLKPIPHTSLLFFCYSGIQRFLCNLTVYVLNLQNGNSWLLHNLFFNI